METIETTNPASNPICYWTKETLFSTYGNILAKDSSSTPGQTLVSAATKQNSHTKKRELAVINIGAVNRLLVVRQNSFGIVLAEELEDDIIDVVLPKPPKDVALSPGDIVEVFVFENNEQQLEATLKRPTVQVGSFAFLKVVDVQQVGAFLDWGVPKDLFVPHHEQQVPMTEGYSYVVRTYLDNSGRIAASSKLDKFLKNPAAHFKIGQEVELLICEETDLGVKAIVDGTNWGLLYHNEIFMDLQRGQKVTGYIKQLRGDDKIDVSLKKPHFEKDSPLLQRIINNLKENGGHSDITDKSAPEKIYDTYGVSKSQYKNALGMLYRKKQIIIEKNHVSLVEK